MRSWRIHVISERSPRVTVSSFTGVIFPNPKLFGTHKFEGGNLRSDLSSLLPPPVMIYGTFPEKFRGSVMEVSKLRHGNHEGLMSFCSSLWSALVTPATTDSRFGILGQH